MPSPIKSTSLYNLHRRSGRTVQIVKVDASSTKLITAFHDGSLRIWDFHKRKSLGNSWRGHDGQINAIEITPDNQKFVSASDDCTLKVWDINTRENLLTLTGHEAAVNAIAITPDGQQIISASDDATLRIWNLTDGNCIDPKECEDSVTSVIVTKDGQYIAFATDTTLNIVQKGREDIFKIQAHDSRINSLFLLPDSNSLISFSDDETLKLWDIDQKICRRVLEGYLVRNSAITSNEQSMIFATNDDKVPIRIWHLETDKVDLLEVPHQAINALAISDDGRWLITASSDLNSEDTVIQIWDLTNKQSLLKLNDHTKPVSTITIAPFSQCFISASADKTLRIWDLFDTQALDTIKKHAAAVSNIAVTHSGEYAISTSEDQTLKLWRVSDGTNLRTFQADGCIDPLLIDDQRIIFASDEKNNLFVQGFLEDAELEEFLGHNSKINAIALTPDSRYAISASEDNSYNLTVWDLNGEHDSKPLEGHFAAVTALTIDTKKQWLISVSMDGILKIWSLENFESLYTFKGDFELSKRLIKYVNIVPQGQYLIPESDNTDLNVWDLSCGELLMSLKERKDQVTAIAITSDCSQAISTTANNTLEVWNIQSNELLHSFSRRHSKTINSIIITPCNRYVVSASDDRTLKVWDLRSNKLDSKEPIATFTGESAILNCAVAPNGIIIAGEKSGRVHFLALRGIED